MSNLTEFTPAQFLKIQQLNLLGSPDIIKSYSLDYNQHNYLILAHILTIGFQSTGIKSGHCELQYITSLNAKDGWTTAPNIYFSFYTTTNALISPDLHCTTSIINIHNKKHTIFKYDKSRMFRDFLLTYQETILQPLPDPKADLSYVKIPTEAIHFDHERYKTIIEKIEAGYDQIIIQNPIISHFMQFYFLQNNLDNNLTKKILRPKI